MAWTRCCVGYANGRGRLSRQTGLRPPLFRSRTLPPPRGLDVVGQRDQRHRIRIERSVAGPSKPAEGFKVTIMPAVPPPAGSTS